MKFEITISVEIEIINDIEENILLSPEFKDW
jgi:hypothetical protein